MGPTPPGTGVIWEATWEAEAKSTSPTKRCPDFFVESDGIEFSKRLRVNQRTWDIICTNINDNNAGFKPRALDKLRFPDGSNKDICFFDLWHCKQHSEPRKSKTYDFGKVLGLAMTLGNSGVLVSEHGRNGTANDVAPS